MTEDDEVSPIMAGIYSMVVGVCLGAMTLVGLALIGKANRNVSGKVKHGTERTLRKGVRHVEKKAVKEGDDDLADEANVEIAKSYLRNFRRDVARGTDVLVKGCCKQNRRKHKLL